jgi:hypothetical protein
LAGGFELARADLDNVSDTDLNAALTGNTIGSLTITTADITNFSLGGVSVTSTAAELNYVDGVTSAIQTQLDAKAPLASPTFTGTVTAAALTVDTDTLHVDATNNRVGVGTSSPSEALTIASAGKIKASRSDNTRSLLLYTDNNAATVESDTDPLLLKSADRIAFETAGTERMRLDSGNLLVGTTTINGVGGSSSPEGVVLDGNNAQLTIGTSSDVSATFNRQTTDGNIVQFRKDGSIVGSIGTGSGDLNINGPAGHSGIRFQASSILPRLNGADTDGTVDLGYDDGTSTHRWKDLYLSGGAYLGGTAAANKLDDYEEGTWTPTATNINATGYSVLVADYTKVGRLVSCDLRVQWTGTANTSASISFSLPFQSSNTPTSPARTGLVFYDGTQIFSGAAISTHIGDNGDTVGFYTTAGGPFTAVASNLVNGSYDWLVSFTYFTDL